MANPTPDNAIYYNGRWYRRDGTTATEDQFLNMLLAGEDKDLLRMLTSNGVQWTGLLATAGGSATLIKSGKTTLVGIIGVAAGTTYVLTPRDNATTTAGGTSFPIGFTNAANSNITDAFFKGAEPIFNAGLVIDATGTPGSYIVLYK